MSVDISCPLLPCRGIRFCFNFLMSYFSRDTQTLHCDLLAYVVVCNS